MNNPPAFPLDCRNHKGEGIYFYGLTMRDYFAAQAMTGAQIWDAVINGKNAQFSQGTEKLNFNICI